MENRAHRNPVFAWLTRNAEWPLMRATLWLAAGLTLASLALTVLQITRVEQIARVEVYPLVVILWIVGWNLHLGVLVAAGPLAAILTARETQDEGFQLLRVTPGYSPGGAVRGLVWAALYRMRVLLVLMVALWPLMMVGSYCWVKNLASVMCYAFVSREEWVEWAEMSWDYETDAADLTCIEPSDRRLLLKSFIVLLLPVGLWGATLLHASLAVWLTLWWGRAGWVWVYPVGVTLCVVAVLTFLGPVIDYYSVGLPYPRESLVSPPPIVIRPWPPYELDVAVPFSVVFYVLAWGVMRLARRWA